MKRISDEQLSALLDGELPAQEMEAIRDALSQDVSLSDRLAQLAIADELVKAQAASIDDVPLPASISALLRPADVLELPFRAARPAAPTNSKRQTPMQRPQRHLQRRLAQYAALAAGIALLIGFGSGYLFLRNGDASTDRWNRIAASLDTAPSGLEIRLDADTVLLSRFTFRGQESTYCRQFLLQDGAEVTENIACRSDSGWEPVASAQSSRIYQGEFTPASGASLLDSTLDRIMDGPALSLDEEAELIAKQW